MAEAQRRALRSGAIMLIECVPNISEGRRPGIVAAIADAITSSFGSVDAFKEQFAKAEAFSYRFERENLASKIADVLEHPKRYVELGVEVAEQFRQNRRPQDFAQFMLDTASHIRLASGPRSAGLQDFFVWPPTKQG